MRKIPTYTEDCLRQLPQFVQDRFYHDVQYIIPDDKHWYTLYSVEKTHSFYIRELDEVVKAPSMRTKMWKEKVEAQYILESGVNAPLIKDRKVFRAKRTAAGPWKNDQLFVRGDLAWQIFREHFLYRDREFTISLQGVH